MTTNKRYFILTHNAYLKINNQALIDLPTDFVNSNAQDKHIKLLNISILKDNEYIKYASFHSPSLCDGNSSQYSYFITTYNPDHETVKKDYPIASKCQHIVFSFKDINGEDIDISTLKFIIELELIY